MANDNDLRKPVTNQFNRYAKMESQQDLTGDIYGSLLVLNKTRKRNPSGEVIWNCKCLCGKLCEYTSWQLRHGERKTCGCKIKPDDGKFDTSLLRATKLRSGYKNYTNCTKKIKNSMFDRYLAGEQAIPLCQEFGVSHRSFTKFIVSFRHKLNQQYELNFIENMKPFNISKLRIDKVLERRFTTKALEKIMSKPEAKLLTNEEMLYSIIFVRTGSSITALKDSGFKECLKVQDVPRLKLLGMYLQDKPNVAKYIMDLRESQLTDLSVTKDKVQLEIINQIEQLKEVVGIEGDATSARNNLLKAIDMLGRSVGAFSDKIIVEQIDPSDALDQLIDMSKKEIANSTYEIEDVED